MSYIRFTEHAITRYIQYCTSNSQDDLSSRQEARHQLEEASPRAQKLERKTPLGDMLWVLDDLGCRLVTKQDGYGSQYPHVCVTILPIYKRSYTAAALDVIQERVASFHSQEEEHREALRQAEVQKCKAAKDKDTPKKERQPRIQEADLRLREANVRLELTLREREIMVAHAQTARVTSHNEMLVRAAEEKTAQALSRREVVIDEKRALRAALRAALRCLFTQEVLHPGEVEEALDEVVQASSGALSSRFFEEARSAAVDPCQPRPTSISESAHSIVTDAVSVAVDPSGDSVPHWHSRITASSKALVLTGGVMVRSST